jgi:hypothetical protein
LKIYAAVALYRDFQAKVQKSPAEAELCNRRPFRWVKA